jgi:hypothetical protein
MNTQFIASNIVVGVGAVLIGILIGKQLLDPPLYFDRSRRISALIDEFTKSPDRQQAALDEIAKDGDSAYMYLLPYLSDHRPLAFGTVKFLSTHPKRTEKYSMMGAKTVGETVLRYLCWSTESCDFGFDEKDLKSSLAQREALTKYCRLRWLDPSKI